MTNLFRSLIFTFTFTLICYLAKAQSYNNNPDIGFINHNVPKSPESASFEKYGKIPVGEYTGTASANVPFYTIKQDNFELPINLSYHASGIKVSQEATWVGLGWDLVPGGRITLEIRGGWDKFTDNYLSPYSSIAESVFEYINMQVAGYPKDNTLVWGCASYPSDFDPTTIGQGDPSDYCSSSGWEYTSNNIHYQDMRDFLTRSSKYAALEPDIYTANFLGKSLKFYIHPFTKEIVMMGENYNYKIEQIPSGNDPVWEITDDSGVKYIFEQKENTKYILPVHYFYNSMTTSWLLTSIIFPNQEYIQLEYDNYGDVFPAPTIIESESTQSGGFAGYETFYTNSNRNVRDDYVYQEPQYLTKIRTKNTDIDFVLGFRDDIGGLGSRKLEQINVKSKETGEVIKSMKLNYEYFQSNTYYEPYFNGNFLQVSSHSNKTAQQMLQLRLKLNSVDLSGSDPLEIQQTYRFQYNSVLLPNKVSVAQDHWGYFNGSRNMGGGIINFTPTLSSLAAEGIIPPYPYMTGTDLSLSGHANRTADNTYAQACMLSSVIYPTGGFTNFEYELHESYLNPAATNFKGGGLRIKRIINFSGSNDVESINTYEYKHSALTTSGCYLGSIDYLHANISHEPFEDLNNWGGYGPPPSHGGWSSPNYNDETKIVRSLLSNGNLNKEGINVGYSKVTKKIVDYKNNDYFSVVKFFQVNDPIKPNGEGDGSFGPGMMFAKNFLHLAPTPNEYLAGKLKEERYFNNTGQLIRNNKNFYEQHLVRNEFFSLSVTDFSISKSGDFPAFYFTFDPVKSFFTTLDSTVTESYDSAQPVVNKTFIEYNDFYQPVKTVTKSSKGDVNALYTTTPLSYTNLAHSVNTVNTSQDYLGSAFTAHRLREKHILNIPIEKISTKKASGSVESVTGGVFYKYDHHANVVESHQLETNVPIPLDEFQRSLYNENLNSPEFTKDSRYKLKQSAEYYPVWFQLKQLTESGKSSSFIVDGNNDHILAVAKNAQHNDIAFTSFETAETGNWIISGGSVNPGLGYTGEKSFALTNGGTIQKTVETFGDYIVSYWSQNGSLTVNGTTSLPKQTIHGWNYHEHQLSLGSGGSVQLVGETIIDELRLYPLNSELTTYTYKPLVGNTSTTNPNSITTHYRYDNFNRLKSVLDLDKNIIKNYEHKYVDVANITPTYLYYNRKIGLDFYKSCDYWQQGSSVHYSVPAEKYFSFISQEDADQQGISDATSNGQAYANNNGNCVERRSPFQLNYSVPAGRTFLLTITFLGVETHELFIQGQSSIGGDMYGGVGYITINEVDYQGDFSLSLQSDSGNFLKNITQGTLAYFGPENWGGTLELVITDL